MSHKLLTSIIIFAILLTSSTYALETDSLEIKRAGNRIVSISNPYGSLWEYSENKAIWSITNSDNGKVVFKKGYDTLAEGKFSGSELTMESPASNLYLFVKLASDKIKVNWNKTDDLWELKRNDDKIKARYNDMEFGKIKYYSDTKKLRVKDRFEKAIAEITPCEKLCFAPGAFLMNDLSEDQQIFVALLLFSRNQ